MNKRKLRINGMDIVILAVIAAALALLLYIFVWSAEPETAEAEYVDLVYVLEVTSLEGQFQNLVPRSRSRPSGRRRLRQH